MLLLVAALGGVVWAKRIAIYGWLLERSVKEAVPGAQPAAQFSIPTNAPPPPLPVKTSPTNSAPSPSPLVVLNDINLAVPFAPQAPLANWDQPYQDACEEATVIMVERYLRGASLTLGEMDAEILRMVDFQNKNYGFYRDTNVAETVRLAQAFYPQLSARARYDVTAEHIRAELSQGHPVVVLVDGRRLGNPFYTAPGPERHTLVIKGVKGDKFITNDPGTKRGADYMYPIPTVMNALEDYHGNTPGTHKRAMIVITPKP